MRWPCALWNAHDHPCRICVCVWHVHVDIYMGSQGKARQGKQGKAKSPCAIIRSQGHTPTTHTRAKQSRNNAHYTCKLQNFTILASLTWKLHLLAHIWWRAKRGIKPSEAIRWGWVEMRQFFIPHNCIHATKFFSMRMAWRLCTCILAKIYAFLHSCYSCGYMRSLLCCLLVTWNWVP